MLTPLGMKTTILVVTVLVLSIAIYITSKKPDIHDWPTFGEKLSENTQNLIWQKMTFGHIRTSANSNWCEYLQYSGVSTMTKYRADLLEEIRSHPDFAVKRDKINNLFSRHFESVLRENEAKRECETVMKTSI